MKNKVILTIILLVVIISCAIYYYNTKENLPINTNKTESEEVKNYETKNVNEFLNNDEIESMNLYVEIKGYKETKDKSKIQEVVKYLKSLTVEKTNEKPGITTLI